METIIAATDFSRPALNALKYAAALTAELNAQLLLVHVVEVPLTPLQVPLTIADFDEITACATEQLDELKEQLSFYTNDLITIHTEVKYGYTETALKNLCGEVQPIAVVVGLSEHAAARLFLGHTALRIVQYIEYPVLIIPEKAVFSGIKNIVIASDLEHIRETTAIEFIRNWLGLFHLSPYVLHVCTNGDLKENTIDSNITLAKDLAEFNPKFHSLYNKNMEDGIFNFLEQKKSDLLLVVPGKYSFFKELFHTSHTKQLILHSHLPVLAVPSYRFRGLKGEKQVNGEHHSKPCNGCDGLCCSKDQRLENQIDEAHSPS